MGYSFIPAVFPLAAMISSHAPQHFDMHLRQVTLSHNPSIFNSLTSIIEAQELLLLLLITTQTFSSFAYPGPLVYCIHVILPPNGQSDCHPRHCLVLAFFFHTSQPIKCIHLGRFGFQSLVCHGILRILLAEILVEMLLSPAVLCNQILSLCWPYFPFGCETCTAVDY